MELDEKSKEALQSNTWKRVRTSMQNEVVGLEESEHQSEETDDEKVENAKPDKKMAIEKLQAELKLAKEKEFADPVIHYLLKRCDEDNGLAEDVAQKHKTWEKCYLYIYSKARGQAKGNCAAVRDDVVYEWAEDYYHQDDKAIEEKKAKEDAERKKTTKEDQKKRIERMENNRVKNGSSKNSGKQEQENEIEPKRLDEKKQEELKPKKNSKDMDGQMDLFSMMGM